MKISPSQIKGAVIEKKVLEIALVWNFENVWGADFNTENSIFRCTLKHNSTSYRFSHVWIIILECSIAN